MCKLSIVSLESKDDYEVDYISDYISDYNPSTHDLKIMESKLSRLSSLEDKIEVLYKYMAMGCLMSKQFAYLFKLVVDQELDRVKAQNL
jgi:hypothetical protein